MTREDIKKIMPDATDEQITNLLNTHNTEKEAVKKSAGKNVSDETLEDLKKKAKAYDDAQREKLSAEEKYEALIQEAEEAKAEAARFRARTKAEAEFIKAGLDEKEYSSLLDDVVTDDDEKTLAKVNRITALIKSKTNNAIKNTTDNLMKDSMKLQSNGGGKEGEKETDSANALAKEAASAATSGEALKNAFDYYK